MVKRIFETPYGAIHYYVGASLPGRASLVFLPGLTADWRLFKKQIGYFEDKCNIFVWDAPGHGMSRPFQLEFSLMDKAKWLHAILEKEELTAPCIVGQSMGGYVAQAYMELYPGEVRGFVSIDSAPLQREYVTGIELWLLKRMEPVYRMYPWKALMKSGSDGVATTEYGKALMREMMESYEKKEYAHLAGHGFKILADAMEANLPYKIDCPAMLICGEEDKAGSAKRYNKKWNEKTNIPIAWIKDAGHNANTDKPEEINHLIDVIIFHTSDAIL